MHQSNTIMPLQKRGRRRASRRLLAGVIASVILTSLLSTGGTLAFIFLQTKPIANTFIPADVSCEVSETFNGTVKSEVKIKNTGKTDAYIRAAVVITWVDENGNIHARKPVAGTDYTIAYHETNWLQDQNGFWYYIFPVAVGGTTENLIEQCTAPEGSAPEGYFLSVEIVASAMQSAPKTGVETYWGVTADENRITAVPSAD